MLAPRAFFRKVAQESGNATLVRIAVYASAFTLLELALVSLAVPVAGVRHLQLLGLAIGEVALGLVFFLGFWTVTYMARADKPAKTALVHSLTFRFVFLPVPLLAYVFFLLTEDYGVALLRGILVWMFLAAYLLFLPIAVNRSVVGRFLGIITSVGVGLLVVGIGASAMSPFSTSAGQSIGFSLLSDPIGTEVDRTDVVTHAGTERRTVAPIIDEIRFLVEGRDSLTPNPAPLVERRLARLPVEWEPLKLRVSENMEIEETRLREALKDSRFRTTRTFVSLRLAEISAARPVLTAVQGYVDNANMATYGAVLDAYISLQDASIAVLTPLGEFMQVRNKLTKLGLLW